GDGPRVAQHGNRAQAHLGGHSRPEAGGRDRRLRLHRRNLRRELRELRPGLERHPGGCRRSRLPAYPRRDPAGNSHRDNARPQVAMELPLAFIGWFFTLASAGALVLGAALIAMLATAGDRGRHADPDSGHRDLRRDHRDPAQPRGDESVFLTGSGFQVSVAFLLLKMRDLHHARGHELDAEDELVLPELAVAQRDLAHLELHTLAHQILYARVEGPEAVPRPLHEEIDAVSVGHRNELRFGIDLEMVVDVAQALGRLLQATVEVIHGLFLRPGGGPRKEQHEDGEQFRCESHGMLLSQSSTPLTLREPARIRKSADGET